MSKATRILGVLACFAAFQPGIATALELSMGGARLNVPVASMRDTKFGATTRQQYDFSCGSAAVATLLSHHYGRRVTEQAVFEHMYAHGDQQKIRRQGFSLLDMQRYLSTLGFRADGFEQPLEKLLAARTPAIVLLSDRGYNHFVVIKGASDGRILVGDPSTGTRAMSIARFHELWRTKLLFVIHSYRGNVVFNSDADWRAAPLAPLADGLQRNAIDVHMPKFGPGDF